MIWQYALTLSLVAFVIGRLLAVHVSKDYLGFYQGPALSWSLAALTTALSFIVGIICLIWQI